MRQWSLVWVVAQPDTSHLKDHARFCSGEFGGRDEAFDAPLPWGRRRLEGWQCLKSTHTGTGNSDVSSVILTRCVCSWPQVYQVGLEHLVHDAGACKQGAHGQGGAQKELQTLRHGLLRARCHGGRSMPSEAGRRSARLLEEESRPRPMFRRAGHGCVTDVTDVTVQCT
jgi:hypothetical protein